MEQIEGYRSARARLGVGAVILIGLLALAVTIGIGVWRGASSPVEHVVDAPQPSGSVSAAPVTEAVIFVHVTGAVRAPGLYHLTSGDRIVDAVGAAGGFTAEADRQLLNLARVLNDGEQVHVPVIGEAPAPVSTGVGPAQGAPVNLNTADAATLDTLPRVGPAIAQRIIDFRTANGPFRAVEDLLAVSGVGPAMLEALADLVTV